MYKSVLPPLQSRYKIVPLPKRSSLEDTSLNGPHYALLIGTKDVAAPVLCSSDWTGLLILSCSAQRREVKGWVTRGTSPGVGFSPHTQTLYEEAHLATFLQEKLKLQTWSSPGEAWTIAP